MSNIYREAACDIPVYDKCDILIVGGGAAGHSAAIAAARAGAKNIILMERYGYMGGDVTGGYVIMVPDLSWFNKSFVRGLQEEVVYPPRKDSRCRTRTQQQTNRQ